MKPPFARRWLLAALLLAGGCSRPEAPLPPPHLLSKSQMIDVLIQLHLLESQLQASRVGVDSSRALYLTQMQNILWQRGINAQDSTFERSYNYYAIHDKDLHDIYDIVIDSMKAREVRLGGNPNGPPAHH